ncbi:fructose-1,6-bisphosphatase I [Monoraphidium neglectum]|uniref:D-fructose-1,6-bisphosphate 1-phosphohydrolase n=1 Tax=Monoraphidium neglectum TaxID=145388 RepID=A0A0D2LM32_9CHLO|nr:fructose-1,6-bisphosphatase I [Monoraphidium neglectum]KIY92869.1 fructose-1,6-bisphosphatase I [Monoraphidium neglectum]|eukprot:XP_013891889.1 fructose-1,6-bisphosphatase I [Monoraphidium neglectum]
MKQRPSRVTCDTLAYLAELKRTAKPYSYRYVGALVGDFHRTLCYGGIWLYPPDSKAPSGKARLLYEVAPMSLIAEQAGGLACVGPKADQRVLDIVPKKVHEKSPLFVGSASEVKKLQAFLAQRKG